MRNNGCLENARGVYFSQRSRCVGKIQERERSPESKLYTSGQETARQTPAARFSQTLPESQDLSGVQEDERLVGGWLVSFPLHQGLEE